MERSGFGIGIFDGCVLWLPIFLGDVDWYRYSSDVVEGPGNRVDGLPRSLRTNARSDDLWVDRFGSVRVPSE